MANDTDIKVVKAAQSKTRKFVAIRKFGTAGGNVEPGDVVELTAPEAKHFSTLKCLMPYIADDEDDETDAS